MAVRVHRKLITDEDEDEAAPRKGKKAPPPGKIPIVQALSAELERSVEAFTQQDPPLYFLGYGVTETHSVSLEALEGVLRLLEKLLTQLLERVGHRRSPFRPGGGPLP